MIFRPKLWPAGWFVNVQPVFPLAVKGKLDHNVSGAFLSM